MSLTPTFILLSAGFPFEYFEHYFVILTSLGLLIRRPSILFFLTYPPPHTKTLSSQDFDDL